MVTSTDKTGQPRSDEDLQEAIDCITTVMVKHATVLPLLAVNAGNTRDCLRELQLRRKLMREAKEKRINETT